MGALKMVLKIKVISGGQTGADQGGLAGAKEAGCTTGGTAPQNFITQEGPNPNLKNIYGLVEGEPDPRVYPKRTKKNVLDSTGTVLFGHSSPGYNLTLKYCRENNKAYIENPTPEQLADWMTENAINILNVAGNREHKHPGTYEHTRSTIYKALKILESRNVKWNCH
jgi:hypothetical protein